MFIYRGLLRDQRTVCKLCFSTLVYFYYIKTPPETDYKFDRASA